MPGRSSGRLMLEVKRSSGAMIVFVGVVVMALATGAIIAGKLTFQRPFTKYTTVRAAFTDAKGIFPGGDSVRIHGVVVGVVSKATIVNDTPILTMNILSKYGPIYKNADFRIRPVTPLDDLYVNITNRGTPSAGVASPTYVFPETQTVTPVDISRILDTFNANTRTQLTNLLSQLDEGLPGGGAQLKAAFAQLAPFLSVAQQATLELKQNQTDVEEAIHNFGTLSSALADRNAALTDFVRNGDSDMAELAGRADPLESTLQQLANLLPTIRSSFAHVDSLTGTLNPTLASLQPVSEHLRSGLQALQQLGTEAVPAIKALEPAVTDLRPMATQLAPTATSLATTFQKLSPETPQFRSLTSDISPCLPALQSFFNNTLSVFEFEDANGAFPRANETVDVDSADGIAGGSSLNSRPIPDCSGVIK